MPESAPSGIAPDPLPLDWLDWLDRIAEQLRALRELPPESGIDAGAVDRLSAALQGVRRQTQRVGAATAPDDDHADRLFHAIATCLIVRWTGVLEEAAGRLAAARRGEGLGGFHEAYYRERVRPLLAEIPWAVREPAVRRALAARASAEGLSVREVKDQALYDGLWLVVGELERTQERSHRFGRRWLTGGDGRKAAFVPEDLLGLDNARAWAWLGDEVVKAAEASLVGQAYPPAQGDDEAGRVPLDAARGLSDPAANPLELLVEDERRREAVARLHTLAALASPAEREILAALARLDLADERGALAAVANDLGLKPSTVRERLRSLRNRAGQAA